MKLNIYTIQSYSKTCSSCLISFHVLFCGKVQRLIIIKGNYLIIKTKLLQDIKLYICKVFHSVWCEQKQGSGK